MDYNITIEEFKKIKNVEKIGMSASRYLTPDPVWKIQEIVQYYAIQPYEAGVEPLVLVGDNAEGGDKLIQHLCRENKIKYVVFTPLDTPRYFLESEFGKWISVGWDSNLPKFDNFHNRDKIIVDNANYWVGVCVNNSRGTSTIYQYVKSKEGFNSTIYTYYFAYTGDDVWTIWKDRYQNGTNVYHFHTSLFGDYVTMHPNLKWASVGDTFVELMGNGNVLRVDMSLDSVTKFLTPEETYLADLNQLESIL